VTRRSWTGDAALAVAIAAVQVAGTALAGRHQPERESFDLLAALLLAAGPAALVVRRRYPVPVLAWTFVTTFAYTVLDYPRGPIFFALIVAFFTAVLTGHREVAWGSLVVGYVAFAWLADRGRGPSWVGALALLAWFIVLATAAEIVRGRLDRRAELSRTRDEEARRRATEERLRIARELHDVLAHNISLINVQAGVALHLMEEQPEQARTALTAIKAASKDALRELRSVLDVLRRADEGAPRGPTAGLSRLDAVLAGAEAAGLAVHKRVEGEVGPLPAGVDLAALRIVQEALTNVARHAQATSVTVRLAYGPDELVVEVEDDGRAAPSAAAAPGGSGIAGMRERAEALGGELQAGPRDGGGFRVWARLPIGS
jgi:signal transduction histidine kinase